MRTPMQQLFFEIRKYKHSTQINGTDYVLVPLNKIDYLEANSLEAEKNQMKSIYSSTIEQNEDGKLYAKNFEQYYNETFKK